MVPRILLERAKKRGTPLVVIFGLSLATAYGLLPTAFASAQGLTGSAVNVNAVTAAAGVGGSSDLITIIGRIINIALGFLGIIFLVLLLYAGFLWMTAAGDATKIEQAQKILRNAIIGLVIIVSAWAITAFIISSLTGEGSYTGGVTGGGARGRSGFTGAHGRSGSLGILIESHVPASDAKNVPRNTPIIITFKDRIDPASFIEGWTDATSSTAKGLNNNVIKIYRTSAGSTAAMTSAQMMVFYTPDQKTFVIRASKPEFYLGSPKANVTYQVDLEGDLRGIQKIEQNGERTPLFIGDIKNGYSWLFEVSTEIDLTPPTVLAATPLAGDRHPRNAIIQITFSEPIDPIPVSGRTSAKQTIQVFAESGSVSKALSGEFRISNDYQTAEFVPDDRCGINSCGRDVFCLPESVTIRVSVKAARPDPKNLPQAVLVTGGYYDGVVDLAGNVLDGKGEGKVTAPALHGENDYMWSFGTLNELNLVPPRILDTTPSSKLGPSSKVALDAQIRVTFDKLLQSSTLNSNTVRLVATGNDEKKLTDTFWWTTGMLLLSSSGAALDPKKIPPDTAMQSAVIILHRPFLPSGTGPGTLNYYLPHLTSDVQDQYQNCFNPASKCGGKDLLTSGPQTCCNGKSESTDVCDFKL